MNLEHKIVGIGEAKIDYYSTIDKNSRAFVKDTLGADKFISWDKLEKLINDLNIDARHAGGSIANTLSILGKFNHKTLMIGYHPHDPNEIFKQNAKEHNITCSFHPHDKPGKGNLLALIDNETKDRSFLNADYSGSENLPPITLSATEKETINQAQYILFEGYDWLIPSKKELHLKLAKHHKDQQLFVFSLSDISVINNTRTELSAFLNNHIDILIGNLAEYECLFNSKGLDETIEHLKRYTDKTSKATVMTASNKGAFLITGQTFVKINTCDVKFDEIVNTNGAGDNFLAGFVYELSQNNVERITELTSQIANKALTKGHKQAGHCLKSDKTIPDFKLN